MNNNQEPYKHTLADWFVPIYENVIETFPNGEKLVTKYLYFPPGFWLFLAIVVLSLLKLIW